MPEFEPGDDILAQMLADQVERSATKISEGQRNARRQLAVVAEQALAHEGGYEEQLAGQTEKLCDRMSWVYDHPFLSRIGKRAIGVALGSGSPRNPKSLQTESITDGAVMRLKGEHFLTSGITFLVNKRTVVHATYGLDSSGEAMKRLYESTGRYELVIKQQVKDEATQAIGSRTLYTICPVRSHVGSRAIVTGSEFDKLSTQFEIDKVTEYLASHPNLGTHANLIRARYDIPITSDISSEYVANELEQRLAMVQLDYFLQANNAQDSVEFPEELYLGPLTLVRQMNMLLGTKTDKK